MNELQTVAALQDTTPNLRNDKQAAANKAKDNQERAATCGGGGVGGGDAQHMVWLPHSTFSGRRAAQCLGATQHIVCFLGGQYHSSAVMAMANHVFGIFGTFEISTLFLESSEFIESL